MSMTLDKEETELEWESSQKLADWAWIGRFVLKTSEKKISTHGCWPIVDNTLKNKYDREITMH